MASGHVNRILKAEHMAAPTNPANVKKALANSEPSTHGTSPTSSDVCFAVAKYDAIDPTATSPSFSKFWRAISLFLEGPA
jgi:hypothetical protein